MMVLDKTSRGDNFMALDVGTVRVGVATAHAVSRLPHAHSTLPNNEELFDTLAKLCHHEDVGTIVVGLPRGLDGQDTAQTRYSQEFADKLALSVGPSIRVELQDEALTSKHAVAELTAAKKQFAKADVDALAAVYILEDFLKENL